VSGGASVEINFSSFLERERKQDEEEIEFKKGERIRSDLYKSIKTKEKDIKSECCVSSPILKSVWLNFIARKDKKLQIEKKNLPNHGEGSLSLVIEFPFQANQTNNEDYSINFSVDLIN